MTSFLNAGQNQMIETLINLGESVDRLCSSGDSPLLMATKQSK